MMVRYYHVYENENGVHTAVPCRLFFLSPVHPTNNRRVFQGVQGVQGIYLTT